MVNVPGSNLLNMAFRAIAKQPFTYYAFASRTANSIGYWGNTYAAPVPTSGSIQAVPKRLYDQLGLDLQKTYFNFFLPQSIIDIGRDVSSDYFSWNGGTYQCLSVTPWFAIDGWVEVLTIMVPTPS